jgi:uncharacterized RDD family membrane protein YckC
MLDTIRQVQTPEGVFLHLRAAGALPRAWAWSIDFILRSVFGLMFMGLLALFGDAGKGTGLVILFLMMWAYAVVCEVCFNGQTLGKRMMGLRVVRPDGTPVTWVPSVVRNLLRVVDILPGVYATGLLSTLMDPYARRIGDIVADTMVIHTTRLPPGQPVPLLAASVPPPGLTQREQAAIVDFAERCAQLTPQRQQELADVLSPLTGCTGEAGVKCLLAYANWLMGRL